MADRKEFEIGGKPLSALRVVDLKLELEKRGLSKSGSKKELADRLKVQLRLEKLQEDALSDEGHVPNLRLQNDEIAENDLIKDYLAGQQQTYEAQKEARRRAELEEQRVRDSSEASAGDTSQGEDDSESKATIISSQELVNVPEIQNEVNTELHEQIIQANKLKNENVNHEKLEENLPQSTEDDQAVLSLTAANESQSNEIVEEYASTKNEVEVSIEKPDEIMEENTFSKTEVEINVEKPEEIVEEPSKEEVERSEEPELNLTISNTDADILPESTQESTTFEKEDHNSDVDHKSEDTKMKDTEMAGPIEREASSSPSRESEGSESRRRRRRSSSNSRSTTSSRSRSSESRSSDSHSRSHKRSSSKSDENNCQPDNVEDSTSQSSVLRPELEVKVNAEEDKMMELEESSSAVDETPVSDTNAGCKSDGNQTTSTLTAKVSPRKVTLSSIKSEEGKENHEGTEVQAPRKRKWGNSGAANSTKGKKTSLTISTDSLKGLISEVKPLSSVNNSSEFIVENVETKPVPTIKPQVTTPTVKRELIVFNSQPEKDVTETTEPPIKTVRTAARRISTSGLTDNTKAATTAARHPPTHIVHIRNLVRPFTLNQLKELLSKTGTLIEGGFWIDKIKSKCYVTYETEEQAVNTRQALHGTQWPSSNPKILNVDFATQDELEFHRSLSEASNQKVQPTVDIKPNIDELNRARALSPRVRVKITVDDEKVGDKPRRDSHRSTEHEKEKERGNNVDSNKRVERGRIQQTTTNESNNVERNRTSSGGRRDRDVDQRSRGKDKNRQPPIREWDREKIGERSPGERDRARATHNRNRSRSRSRSRGAKSPLGRRDRTRDGDIRDRNDRRREEEAPAKLLDDLFRKTKATPCIYWLPLTAEQIHMKEEQRKQRQVEREKRRQQNDQTDTKASGQRSRSRDKEDVRNWRKSKSPTKSRSRRR